MQPCTMQQRELALQDDVVLDRGGRMSMLDVLTEPELWPGPGAARLDQFACNAAAADRSRTFEPLGWVVGGRCQLGAAGFRRQGLSVRSDYSAGLSGLVR